MPNYILLSMDHPLVRQFFTGGATVTRIATARRRTRGARGAALPTAANMTTVQTKRRRRRRARRQPVANQITG
jgi:hypothetical protein